MTLKKEIDDVLRELKKKQKKGYKKEVQERMRNTDRWAKTYGKRKKPKWVKHFWSYHPELLKLTRGYYHSFGFATKITKGAKITRGKNKGKQKSYLELYDTVARSLK